MNPHFTSLDLVVLVAYFAATMAVGLVCWRRSRSVESFTAAERNLPGWLTGLSILGTYVSSISFLALPGKAFAANWNPFVFSLALPLATWIGVKWFVPFYRRQGAVSAFSHLEARFGAWARAYAAGFYLLTQLARIGTVTYLMALPMAVLLGWDIHTIILITGVAVVVYSMIGGVLAVIWTDAVQTVVLIAGALMCLLLMIGLLPGGIGEFFATARAHDKFSLGTFAFDLGTSSFWVVLAYGVFVNLQNFGVDQNYVQRYAAARSDAEARKSVWIGGLLYLPLSAVFFLIGSALFVYYRAHPEGLPVAYQDAAKSDYVFPWFIVSVLPSGVTGLLVAAIFAAAMSTISTSLNSSATILLKDFYLRYVNPQASEARSLRFLREMTILWGALGIGVAILMTRVGNALDAWWMLAGIFSGGTLGLFLLGLLSRRATSRAALGAVALGLLAIVWLTLSPRWAAWPETLRSPFHGFLTIVFGTSAIVLAGFAFSFRSQPSSASTSSP